MELKKTTGQGLIEVIFSVGVVVLVITGVVVLMVGSMSVRTKVFDRKKAGELNQKVMESVVQKEMTEGLEFWDLNSSYWLDVRNRVQTTSDYPGYVYQIGVSQHTGSGCSALMFECATVTVTVGWSGTSNQLMFNRFFSRK